MISLQVNTSNASTQTEDGQVDLVEVAYLLRNLADKLEDGFTPATILDYNGNSAIKIQYDI